MNESWDDKFKDLDIWVCLKCGRTITAPKNRNYEPNIICKHYELTEYEEWIMMRLVM